MGLLYGLKGFVLNLMFLVLCLLDEQNAVHGDIVVGGNCPDLTQSLGDGCSVNDDCTKITCSQSFATKDITFTLDIDKCGDPVSVTARMQVPDLGVDWSHKYESNDIVAVPGFSVNYHFFSIGVYVKVQLNSEGDLLNMKVKLLAGASISDKSKYPFETKIVDSDLPIGTSECGIVRWWRNLGTALQAVVIGAPIFVIILLISCCCCCCFCCRTTGRRQGVVVLPGTQPNPALMTTTKSTVGMKPLENVA